jgi:hypothetical protein
VGLPQERPAPQLTGAPPKKTSSGVRTAIEPTRVFDNVLAAQLSRTLNCTAILAPVLSCCCCQPPSVPMGVVLQMTPARVGCSRERPLCPYTSRAAKTDI